jgi:hypothetical protein
MQSEPQLYSAFVSVAVGVAVGVSVDVAVAVNVAVCVAVAVGGITVVPGTLVDVAVAGWELWRVIRGLTHRA